MATILIVDDHAVVRQGVRQILASELPDAAFGEASDSSEAIRAFREQAWDVVVLDLNMPGAGGLELIREMKSLKPDCRLVVLSMHPEDPYAVRVLRAGAMAYVSKDSAMEELGQAVVGALKGIRHVSPSVAELLVKRVADQRSQVRHERLSSREFEVFRRLAAGDTVGHVARALSLSPKTVSTYRSRILEKMEMSSNAELTRYAMKHGLLPDGNHNSA